MTDTLSFPSVGTGPVYEKTDIWLPLLFAEAFRRGEKIIEGKTFIDCHIEGPAVMIPISGVHFEACDLGNSSGDPHNLMLAPLGPDHVTGALGFKDCTFTRCSFLAIGFTGSRELLKGLHDGLKGPSA